MRHPIYVLDGVGDVHGLLRTDKRVRKVARGLAFEAGRGPSTYTRFDTHVADAAVRWIRERANRNNGGAWVLFASMLSPHYPLIAPDEFYDLYTRVDLPRPRLYEEADRPDHPETHDVQGRLYGELRKIVDPDEINQRAFADQKALIEQLGGVKAILSREDFNLTPVPE